MTNKVIQADRDAAAELVTWHNTAAAEWHIKGGADLRFFAADMPDGIRAGIWDEHPVVQALAQHRISSISPYIEALREARELIKQAANHIEGVKRGGHWIGPSWGDETNLWREFSSKTLTQIDNLLEGGE